MSGIKGETMNDHEHRGPKYSGDALKQLRTRHDQFVSDQARRLGVNPSDILAAVKDYGLTADQIANAEDAGVLTRYPNHRGQGLKIIGYQPVKRIKRDNAALREFRATESKPKAKPRAATDTEHKTVKKLQRKRTQRPTGTGSMAAALRSVGFLTKP